MNALTCLQMHTQIILTESIRKPLILIQRITYVTFLWIIKGKKSMLFTHQSSSQAMILQVISYLDHLSLESYHTKSEVVNGKNNNILQKQEQTCSSLTPTLQVMQCILSKNHLL